MIKCLLWYAKANHICTDICSALCRRHNLEKKLQFTITYFV